MIAFQVAIHGIEQHLVLTAAALVAGVAAFFGTWYIRTSNRNGREQGR